MLTVIIIIINHDIIHRAASAASRAARPGPVGGTQTGSYQTGSYQKGRFIPPKPGFWEQPHLIRPRLYASEPAPAPGPAGPRSLAMGRLRL